jgi:phosphoserine phosphatase RsbU/P
MSPEAQRAASTYVGAPQPSLPTRVARFWNRISGGLNFPELWNQLRADARSTYRLYSSEIDARRRPGESRSKQIFAVAAKFFWAILDKLTPARRVLLLVALVLLFVPQTSIIDHAGNRWELHLETRQTGGLLMFCVLLLELTDRVAMKRDLQIAKEIQAWLLPAHPPNVPDIEIAFATRPANTVAGDYYDVFPRRASEPGSASTTFLIAVADVAGKSIPAAMLMATIQASLHTLSTTAGSLPELALRMNHYACTNSQNGRRFTTAFLAEYEPASRVLTYVNAGHNPPLLRRRSGNMEELAAGGLPLGVLDDAAYKSGAVTLASGDLLAIFTDGVVEAENAQGQEYSQTRLLAALEAHAAAPPAILLSTILFDIARFVGSAPQHDDVTLVLLKAA